MQCVWQGEQWDKVRAALDAGFPVTSADGDGWTLAHAAADRGHLPTLSRLLAMGADPNARSANGTRPTFLAARNGHLEATEALVAAGGDVNAPDSFAWTPLLSAAMHGHLPVARFLLALPWTNLLATDWSGKTAEQLARGIGGAVVARDIRLEVGVRVSHTGHGSPPLGRPHVWLPSRAEPPPAANPVLCTRRWTAAPDGARCGPRGWRRW